MTRSTQRRGGPLSGLSRNKRIATAASIFLAFGLLVTVQQVSSAKERTAKSAADCGPSVPGSQNPNGANTTVSNQNGRQVRDHWGDGQDKPAGCVDNSVNTSAVKIQAAGTANCPDVKGKVKNVPNAAKKDVDAELAQLDKQIADANKALAAADKAKNNKANAEKAALDQLKAKRTASIKKIVDAIDKAGNKPQGLEGLATCTLAAGKNDGKNNDGKNNGGNNNDGKNNDGKNNDGKNNDGKNNDGKNNDGKNNNNGGNNGGKLDIIAQNCKDDSKLTKHDGFQKANRCVETEMGEVGSANKNPSLLITDAPNQVKVNQAFSIKVATRNLIRDRFLAAGQGGYYVEMSKLSGQGLVRGHFHTACRILNSTNVAPDAAPVPAFFVATEDGGGSGKADRIQIKVPGLPEKGTFQCASWAGDGSHRLPMMERANQTPAFDAVRITVK
jgi:hypothetical protein